MADTQYNIDLVLNAKNQASIELDKVSGQVNSIGATIGKLGISAGIISGMKSFASSTLELGGNLEQASIAFETMLGSGEEADKMLKDLSDFAKKTPFELTGVRDSAKQLMAYGFSAEEVIPTLKALGDVASGLSVPIGQLALPMGQVKVAGKLLTNDLKQFQNAGVDLVGELSKNLGKSKAEIQEMVSKGQISADMVEEAFETMTSAGGKFEDLMSKQSGTYQGMMSNLQDSFDGIKESLGMAILPILEKLLSAISPIIERIAERVQENPKLATTIAGIVAGLLGLVAVLGSLSIIMPVITGALTLLTNPLVALPAIIGVVVGGLALLESHIMSTDEQIEMYINEIALLDEQLEAGTITQDEYNMKVAEYKSKIQEAEEKSKTFGGYLKNELNNTLKSMIHPVQSLKDLRHDRQAVLPQIKNHFHSLTEKIGAFIEKVKEAINRLKEFIRESAEAGMSAIKNTVSNVKSAFSGKAVGGPVYAGTPYLVGENGPEMFIPSTNGNITRNEDLGNMGGITIQMSNNFTVADGIDQESIAETIANTITRQLELYKKAIY